MGTAGAVPVGVGVVIHVDPFGHPGWESKIKAISVHGVGPPRPRRQLGQVERRLPVHGLRLGNLRHGVGPFGSIEAQELPLRPQCLEKVTDGILRGWGKHVIGYRLPQNPWTKVIEHVLDVVEDVTMMLVEVIVPTSTRPGSLEDPLTLAD